MSRFQVAVTDFIRPPLDLEERHLGDIADVSALEAMSEDDLAGRIEDVDAMMVYHFITLSAKTINRLNKCKLIVRCGVGFDNVDLNAAKAKGIPVANVPDYGTEEVADSAIGLTLSLTRGIHLANSRMQRQADAWTYHQVVPLNRHRTMVFGLLGMGRIGIATALRAKALGMKVVYFDPYIASGLDKAIGVQQVDSLDELLSTSDVLSIHCPRTPETSHLINAETIARMKPGSYLVNTSRGGVVDAVAVLHALESEHLRGAALDVLEVEPPHADDPVVQAWRDPRHPAFDRLILNPHSAFYSEQGLDDMRIKGSTNCRQALLGKRIINVVNDVQ